MKIDEIEIAYLGPSHWGESKQRTLDLSPHPSLPAYPRKHRGVPSWEASTQRHMPGTPHLTRRDPGQKLKPTELAPFEKGEIKTEITYWIYTQPSSSVFFWSTTVIFNLTAWGFQVLLQCILAPADCKTVQEIVGWISSKVPCCFKKLGCWRDLLFIRRACQMILEQNSQLLRN